MVNFEKLNDIVDASGMTVTSITKRAGMDRATYYNRLNGIGEFKASEIEGLTKALKLTNKQRDEIFFCKEVE